MSPTGDLVEPEPNEELLAMLNNLEIICTLRLPYQLENQYHKYYTQVTKGDYITRDRFFSIRLRQIARNIRTWIKENLISK